MRVPVHSIAYSKHDPLTQAWNKILFSGKKPHNNKGVTYQKQ